MGITSEVFLAVITAMAICGTAGRYVARDKNFNPVLGFLIGALFPLVGVGVLMMLNRKSNPVR